MSEEEGVWLRRLERERHARKEAERILEAKSRELYEANQSLQRAQAELEQRVEQRTRELAEVSTRLQAVLDSATQVSIIATDPDGVIRVFNAGAERMLGYSAEEMVDRHTPQLIHLPGEVEEHAARLSREYGRPIQGFETFVARAREGTHELREWTYVRKDGKRLPVNLVVTAVRNPEGQVTGYLGIASDISERKQAEERSQARQALLDSIRRAQSKFIAEEEAKPIFGGLLADLLELTQSEYGFIGEVMLSPDGRPYLVTQAISDIAWDEPTRRFHDQHAATGLEFHDLETLFGPVITTGYPVLANDPATDPRRGGLPPGHPPLLSFLGLPFRHGDETIGMVGIANRPGGYTEEVIEYLAPLLSTCAQLTQAHREQRSRRRAEEAILDREARIRSIVESAVDGIVVIDENGRIESFNPAAERLFGFRVEEVVGTNVNILMPSPHAEEHDAHLRRYLETGEAHIIGTGRETVARRKDGTLFPIDLTISEFRLAEGRRFTGIIRDITSRKLAEASMAESAALTQFSAAVGHALAHGGDLRTILGRCTEAAILHLGVALARIWTLDEYQGVLELQASSGMYTHLDGNHARIRIGEFKIGRIAEQGKPHLTNAILGDPHIADQQWAKREGLVAFAGHPLIVEGRVLGVIAMFSRKPLTPITLESLTTVADSIAVGVERLRSAEELQRVQQETMAANRAKSDFLANMSHEVRTPMTAVLGYTDMLLEPHLRSVERIRAVQAIRRNGKHLLEIINDVLDLSKIEAGKIDVEVLPCRPGSIVSEVLSVVALQSSEKGLTLRARPTDPLPAEIVCDPTRLRQILVNLLSNAVKFTHAGRIELRVRLEREGPDGWLLFEVEDQGIGMTPEEMSRLFHPFSQGDTSTTRKYGGTGLGLSISQRLAAAMGGRIDVVSKSGIGSTFTLRLPVKGDQLSHLVSTTEWTVAPESQDEEPPAPLMRLSGKVLLAEDNQDNQRILTHLLNRLGLTVVVAEDGDAAITRAMNERFDLVLMDMQMPKLDGYAATSFLRQQGYMQPVVALTAHAMRGEEEKCLRAGCTAFLAKPIDRHRLAKVLAMFLPTTGELAGRSRNSNLGLVSLVREYTSGLEVAYNEVKKTLKAQDRKSLGRLAHQMRGSAGMYGFPELTEIAGLLEDACREEQELDLVSELVEELGKIIDQIRQKHPESK